MVASLLQDDLVEELKVIFDGFHLSDPEGKLSGINIYPQNLPIPESEEQKDIPIEQLENGLANDKTKEDPYPYIIVRVADGEIEDAASAQRVSTTLLIGVYDDSYEKHGSKDVMNIIQKIYTRFAKKPVLNGKYTIQYPISWTLQDEESYPFYFGGISLEWETAAIRREDKFA